VSAGGDYSRRHLLHGTTSWYRHYMDTISRFLSACALIILALLPLSLALAAAAPLAAESVGEFSIRPVVPLDAEQRAALQELVASDSQAASMAAALAAEAQPLLDAEPQPLAVIHYEGLINTDPQRIATVASLREMDDVAVLMQYWQLTGDPQAADALLRFVDAWASTYQVTGNDVNENKFVPLFVSWECLQSQADPAVQQRVNAWIEALIPPHAEALRTSTHFTNRYTKHVRMVALFGMIRGRQDLIDLARQGVQTYITESLYGDGESLDLKHRDTLTYHGSGLKPPLEVAMILGADDLYTWENERGGSMKKSVDYVIPYATGEKTHQEWVHTEVELDRQRAAAGLEKYRTGRLFEPKDAAELLVVASYFDPSLAPLAVQLSEGEEGERFPSWRMLVNAAVAKARPESRE
jgi:hypothetical protein